MPNYDFRCDTCGHVFENRVSFETKLVFCPQCHCEAARRLPSAPAFQLKGTGFYKNDYGKKEERSE